MNLAVEAVMCIFFLTTLLGSCAFIIIDEYLSKKPKCIKRKHMVKFTNPIRR